MAKGQKKPNTNLRVREWIVSSARNRLQKVADFATNKQKKTIERFEKELETERQSLIERRQKEIDEGYRRTMASVLEGYRLREEAKQKIAFVPEIEPEIEEAPKKEVSVTFGNPFKTDGHGQLLGEERDDGDYLRSPNVRRIYGRKG